jgi:hypothetical protein
MNGSALYEAECDFDGSADDVISKANAVAVLLNRLILIAATIFGAVHSFHQTQFGGRFRRNTFSTLRLVLGSRGDVCRSSAGFTCQYIEANQTDLIDSFDAALGVSFFESCDDC